MSGFFARVEGLMREMIRDEVRAVLAEKRVSRRPTAEQTPHSNSVDRLLNATEVAEILGVSPQRVYELARQRDQNGFPVIILGERQYRFSRDHLAVWLEKSSIGNLAENEGERHT